MVFCFFFQPEGGVKRRAFGLTTLDKLIQQAAPLASKNVGAGEAAVAAAHAQVGDPPFH